MDWSKAKNILIISFVLTNIFLAYVLFSLTKDESEIDLQDELIVEVIDLLKKQSINIETDIPKELPKLPIISVKYETYDIKAVLDNFFEDYDEEIINGNKVYRNENKIIKFEENNKKIVYMVEDFKSTKKEEMNENDVVKLAESFIISHGFSLEDARLSNVKYEQNRYKVFYNKIVDESIVEQTDMIVEISQGEVISFERYWIKAIEKEKQFTRATSVTKALLRLLAREEYRGETIEKIELCYYFNIDDYKDDVNLEDGKGGIAFPTWRILFKSGKKVFLEEN